MDSGLPVVVGVEAAVGDGADRVLPSNVHPVACLNGVFISNCIRTNIVLNNLLQKTFQTKEITSNYSCFQRNSCYPICQVLVHQLLTTVETGSLAHVLIHRVNSRALYAYIRECAYNIFEPHPVTGCLCDEGRLFYGSLQATHPLILSVRVTPSLEALKVTMFILRESILRSCSTEYATVCSSPGAARSTLPRYTRLQAVCVCGYINNYA